MITVNEQKEFHLSNGKISYIFRVMEKTGVLEQLYFGKAIASYDSYVFLIEREVRPSNNLIDGDHTSSLEHVKQEFPVYGTTDFRYPALEIEYPDGDRISHFEFLKYEIKKEKKTIPGLPTSFANQGDVEVLTVYFKDRYSDLILELDYAIFSDFPVVTRRNRIVNAGKELYKLKRMLSMSLDLPNQDYQWIYLDGAWARETQLKRESLHTGIQQISSTRGASSHVHNPFLALCTPNTTEEIGEVYGFSLIYSGNFIGQVELDTYGVARVQLGINPFQFEWELASQVNFETPEVVMSYTDSGLNGMSQNFHEFFKEHLIRQNWVHRPRPILVNNWEATYFNFTEKKILEIASTAQALGIDMLVLDDGWFGNRDSDNGSLGDWYADIRKLPEGIQGLSKKIKALGLKFGLWFEPEMISKDTQLYLKHPDWVVGHPEKNISHGRNQYVLDFSRTEVVEQIFHQMDQVLSTSEIDYVKWDMNRYISEAYSISLGKKRQGEFFHRYILGVYALYEKLLERYPELLIESCAGGGGRFDAGLLYYAPQTWVSDDTDAVERLKIQYGTSLVYPLSSMGSHVSEVPNHQVARITSLKNRGDVAMFGTFGYELDLTKLDENQKEQVKKQVQEFKKYQELIHSGLFYRLISPYEKEKCAWMVVSKDQSRAIVGIYHPLAKPNPGYERIRLQGLNPTFRYQVNESLQRFGEDLMSVGLILGGNYIDRASDYWQREKPGDYHSQIFVLESVID